MSDFEIGAFYLLSKNRANVEILETGASQMARGSKEMVAEILLACDVKAEIRSWSICPNRSYFFCGFPDAQRWEDRWRKGWTITIELSGVPILPNALAFAPGRPLDVCDPTWLYDDRIAERDRQWFTLIAKPNALSRTEPALRAEAILGQANRELQNFKILATFHNTDYLFLRLDFSSFDGNEERRIVAFISELRRRGYLTHWHHML